MRASPAGSVARPFSVRSRPLAAVLVAATALAVCGPAALAQSDDGAGRFRAQFWAEVEPVSDVGDPWPVPPEERARRLLDEAAWVYSGMIWGFSFSYTPYDKVRGIAERFDLASLGSLKAGDPRLELGRTRTEAGMTRAFVTYRPSPDEERRVSTYAEDPWQSSQGIGHADYLLGWKAHRASFEDGLREAVRSYLRMVVPNKPRRVLGRVVFERAPVLSIADGVYASQVRVRIEVLEVMPYEVY